MRGIITVITRFQYPPPFSTHLHKWVGLWHGMELVARWKIKPKFNFSIGDLWDGATSQRARIYSYSSEVHYGTIDHAERMREFLSKRAGRELSIFILTKLELI